MKPRKLISCILISAMSVLLLSACGNTGSAGGSSSKNVPTLSEYANNGTVILYRTGHIKKDSSVRAFVLENGQVYAADLGTLSDISGMTDDEVIAAVKAKDDSPSSYVWQVETDDTGNATQWESLYYVKHDHLTSCTVGATPISGTVLDSYYAGCTSDSDAIITRCEEGTVPFTVDTPDNDNVAVDIYGPDIRELLNAD